MNNVKKIILVIALLILLLLIRDVPYLNIFVINKVWIGYIILLFFLFPPKNVKHLFYLTAFFFCMGVLFVFINFPLISEAQGIILYFLLWIVLVLKIKELLKDKEK